MFINSGVVANQFIDDGSDCYQYCLIVDTKDGLQEFWSHSDIFTLELKEILTGKNYKEYNFPSHNEQVGKAIARNLKLDYRNVEFKCSVPKDTYLYLYRVVDGSHYRPSSANEDAFYYELGTLFLTPMYIRFTDGRESEVTVETNSQKLASVVEACKKSLKET